MVQGDPLPALLARIDDAADVGALARAAEAARAQVAAGAHLAGAAPNADIAGEVTATLSTTNDRVTARAVALCASDMGVDMKRACWLVFGSQARGEQTLITDQDNGLVFAPSCGAATGAGHADPSGIDADIDADIARELALAGEGVGAGDSRLEQERALWLAFGQRVNEVLARCGYPLCEGRIMAGQPLCCLTRGEWHRRFSHWLAHGNGNDLFAARIYFDLRPAAGNATLVMPLQALLRSGAAALPRFIKQMADIVLARPVPLGWRGQVLTKQHQGQEMFDLKLSGTALFVDAARLWALAHRLPEVGTVPRLRAAARALRVPPRELQDWVGGFEALQALRLQLQRTSVASPSESHERTWVPWDELSAPQRESLKQALRAARVVQQRIELDYCR